MSRPAARVVCARHALGRTLLFGAVFLAGCASGGSGQVSGSVYAGVGYNDPWYWGACCYDNPSVIVGPGGGRPSDGRPPVRPEQPIAKPSPSPRPTPMPRPSAGGRRR